MRRRVNPFQATVRLRLFRQDRDARQSFPDFSRAWRIIACKARWQRWAEAGSAAGGRPLNVGTRTATISVDRVFRSALNETRPSFCFWLVLHVHVHLIPKCLRILTRRQDSFEISRVDQTVEDRCDLFLTNRRARQKWKYFHERGFGVQSAVFAAISGLPARRRSKINAG